MKKREKPATPDAERQTAIEASLDLEFPIEWAQMKYDPPLRNLDHMVRSGMALMKQRKSAFANEERHRRDFCPVEFVL